MNKKAPPQPQLPAHGASVLPSVTVDSYNVEIEDDEGFVGDKASKGAFWELLDKWRKPLQRGGRGSARRQAQRRDRQEEARRTCWPRANPRAAALVQSAIEEFAQQLAYVIRRFMRLKEWRDTECHHHRRRLQRQPASANWPSAARGLLLQAEGIDIDLELIRHDPDEAGLLGAAHLLPAWMLKGHDGILAVDVGGTNIRAGIVELNLGKVRRSLQGPRREVRVVAPRRRRGHRAATTPSTAWSRC